MSPASSHFPNIDRLELVVRAWPKLLGERSRGTHPLHLDQSTLHVLCQGEEIAGERDELVRRLNRELDGEVTITRLEACPPPRQRSSSRASS